MDAREAAVRIYQARALRFRALLDELEALEPALYAEYGDVLDKTAEHYIDLAVETAHAIDG